MSDFKEILDTRGIFNSKTVELIRREILIAKGLIHNPFCALISSNNPVFCISIYGFTLILKPNRKVSHSLSPDGFEPRDFPWLVRVPRPGVWNDFVLGRRNRRLAPAGSSSLERENRLRSEERRVGKECRGRWE